METETIQSIDDSINTLENSIQEILGDRFRGSEIWDESDGEIENGELIVKIWFTPEPQTTMNRYRKKISSDYKEILKQIFTNSLGIKEANITASIDIMDKYANDRVVWVDFVRMYGSYNRIWCLRN